MPIVTFLAALSIAAVYLIVTSTRSWSDEQSANRLSFAGGCAAAYGFLVIMPSLAKVQPELELTLQGGITEYLAYHAYLIALFGMCAYYGADVTAARIAAALDRGEAAPRTLDRLTIAWRALALADAIAFAFYAFLAGYLASKSSPDLLALVLLTAATGVHVFAIAYKLRQSMKDFFDRVFRWVLALATLGGWTAAVLFDTPAWIILYAKALFGGVLLFSALRDKMPHRERARLGPFLLGAAAFAAVILITENR